MSSINRPELYTIRFVFEERHGDSSDTWYEFVKNVEHKTQDFTEYSEDIVASLGHIRSALKFGGRQFAFDGYVRNWDRVHVIGKAHMPDRTMIHLVNLTLGD